MVSKPEYVSLVSGNINNFIYPFSLYLLPGKKTLSSYISPLHNNINS